MEVSLKIREFYVKKNSSDMKDREVDSKSLCHTGLDLMVPRIREQTEELM